MSGNHAQFTLFESDEYNDTSSVQILLDPQTQKYSKKCRIVVGVVALVTFILLVILCSVNISHTSSRQNLLGNNHTSSEHNSSRSETTFPTVILGEFR